MALATLSAGLVIQVAFRWLGLAAVANGPDAQAPMDTYRNFRTSLFDNFSRLRL